MNDFSTPREVIMQQALAAQMVEVLPRELAILSEYPCDIYLYTKGLFKIAFPKTSKVNPALLNRLPDPTLCFILQSDLPLWMDALTNCLRLATRSLSMGDPAIKGPAALDIITRHLRYVYRYPTNDELLRQHFLCRKNLIGFLAENHHLIKEIADAYTAQKHYYLLAQPILSSLLLIGLLKNMQLISAREVEDLFLTSYFKDIGMSYFPPHKFDQKNLTRQEKDLLATHPQHSLEILNKRLSFGPAQMRIIEFHHAYAGITAEYTNPQLDQQILGFETMVISMMDIIAAMITPRPYREALPIYDALHLVKYLIADQFPSEFKLMVGHFHQFFKAA